MHASLAVDLGHFPSIKHKFLTPPKIIFAWHVDAIRHNLSLSRMIKCAVGADVEWFKLHDVVRRASGELEAAVSLAAACVDIDKRRAIYDLPLAVAPEKRVTRGDLEK